MAISNICNFIETKKQKNLKFSLSCWKQSIGDILCSFIPFITLTGILVNSLVLAGVALDRYLAVVKYIKGTWNPGTMFSASCAVIVWGFAAGISSPVLSAYQTTDIAIVSQAKNKTTFGKACYCAKVSLNLNNNSRNPHQNFHHSICNNSVSVH